MIIALLLATAAPAVDVTSNQQAAYFAGRCHTWMTTFDTEETLKSMVKTGDPTLPLIYQAGVDDTAKTPVSAEFCAKAYRKVLWDMNTAKVSTASAWKE